MIKKAKKPSLLKKYHIIKLD